MANAIKPLFSSVTAFTITYASLASSTSGAGRQSTLVDNTTTRYSRIQVATNNKLGTSPTAGKSIKHYGIRSNKDSTAIRDDAAGASDAAWTQKNADYMYTPSGRPSVIYCGSAATGDVFKGVYYLDEPGPEWGMGTVHDTGVNFDSTGSNHVASWLGINPEVQ